VCADVEANVESTFTNPFAANKPTNPFTNSSAKEPTSITSPSDFIEGISGKPVPLFPLLFSPAVYMLFFV
jgi:hypothetical protein